MISQIRGVLIAAGADYAVADVHGVGYKLFIPLSEASRLPALGEEAKFFVTTYVREDALALYGFLEERQRDLFELLLGVSGVGPKVALALLSVLSPSEFLNAVAQDDARQIQRAPGVGLKSAQRIILELKDRVAGIPREAGAGAPVGNAASDAVEALQSLGYSRSEASKAVESALQDVENRNDTGILVRAALRRLTKS
jgi:Holliday junction DNA helicase RuvA